jgi:hypothetical protein
MTGIIGGRFKKTRKNRFFVFFRIKAGRTLTKFINFKVENGPNLKQT